MSITRFPHGVSSFGVPLVGSRFSNPWTTHYFVDGDSGSDGSVGTTPEDAFKTIQKAITISSAGDVIYIRPKTYTIGTGFARYSEDVSVTLGGGGGSGVTATNANKSLIGVTQRTRPSDFLGVRWTFATATQLTVDAPALHIENIGFFSELGTYTINLRNNGATWTQQGSAGFSIYNCEVKGEAKLYSDGGDGIQIVNCRFQSKYDGTTGGIQLVGSSNQVKRAVIQACEFIGGNSYNMATAPINTAAPCWDLIIRDCYFSVDTDTVYMVIAGTSNTGMVANCYFGSADINALCTGLVAGTSGVFGTALYDEAGIDSFAS
jgi:hypothetical protein